VIIKQSPAPGEHVKEGSSIRILLGGENNEEDEQKGDKNESDD
jgi:beta-lactam-binding protein with PASTA domain